MLTDILVHLDHFASSAARLEVAVAMARQHRARLTGLLVVRHGYPMGAGAAAVQDLFQQRVAEAGIANRWQSVDGSAIDARHTEIVLEYARTSDLLVVGQGSRASAEVGIPNDLPERAVLESGRPVLIVPYAGAFATVGEHALVAWKPGRESARAVHDALPILKLAKRVEVLAKQRPETALDYQEQPCAGICANLAQHGITAQAHTLVLEGVPLGEVLLNRVFDEGFDLLVIGAQAYGQEGKLTFGSVAHQILREMTVPVLMSH